MADKKIFLVDFDSTFIKSEGLDELAAVVLEKDPQKEIILEKIKEITKKGMEGKMPFHQSLEERIKLLKINRTHIEKLAGILKKHISESIQRNKEFFKTYKDNIYIISGGFRECIVPVINGFGIEEDHVFANTFTFDNQGNVTGFDKDNFLSQDNGKVKLVQSLKLDGDIYVIGDGYTDYRLKELNLVKGFIAYTENVEREVVTKNADYVVPSFDEFLYIFDLPRTLSYPKNKIKVLLLENVHPVAAEIFRKEGYQVETMPGSLNEDELIEKIQDVSIIGSGSRTSITRKVAENAPRLLAVARFGIGVNNIDMAACAEKGIVVFNAPYSNTRSVVELVLGEILMLARRVFEKSSKLEQKIWDKNSKDCFEVRGKTLGIVGYGNIGSQLSVVAEMLGMNILFYDVQEKLALGNAHKCNTLEELLSKSDVITLHIDGRKTNTNFIGQKEFKQMKDGALFINASRGFTVDIEALAENIKSGKLKGAAVDVFPHEPKSNSEPFTSVLQGLPNVILTPHIGGRSEEAQFDMGKFVPEKVINFINTGNTLLSLNFPNLVLPELKNAHRLIHIHKNVPGIMAKINGILGEYHINIVGQYLGTNENIGYVITDVSKMYDKEVLEVLKNIPNTIRFRVLY